MRLSFAVWEPQHAVDDGPRDTRYQALILHTAVSGADDLNFPNPARPGVGCHGYITKDGTFKQYLDTDRATGHAWDANGWAVGIETWDNGDPDHTPWNQAQLDTIDRICRELAVPAQALKEAPSDGLGYHRQYNSWNQSNHSCPTDTRIAQIPGIIARLATGGDDMATFLDDIGLDADTVGNALAFVSGQHRQRAGASRANVAADKNRPKAKLEGFDHEADLAAIKAKLGA